MFLELQPFLQILLSALLGAIIGLEREYQKKQAGFRTFSLVCTGACLLTIIGFNFHKLGSYPLIQLDPTRIIQAVAVGIGFLGAGLIIFKGSRVEGLTTAAGLWIAAAIGIAVGAEMYVIAVFTALLVIVVLTLLGIAEKRLFPHS